MQTTEWVSVTGSHDEGVTTDVTAFAWVAESDERTISETGRLVVRREDHETVAYSGVERWVYEGLRQWAYKDDRVGFDLFFDKYVRMEYDVEEK